MQARIKQDARYASLSFFSGVEFTKSEWRDVPTGREFEAVNNDYLETREGAAVNPTHPINEVHATLNVVPAEMTTEQVAEVVKPKKTTRTRKAGK